MRLLSSAIACLLLSCGTYDADVSQVKDGNAAHAQQTLRQYDGVVRSHDGSVAFNVSVRTGESVSDEAARRLLSEMVIAIVPEEVAEPIAPRSADIDLDFGECDTLAAVTISASNQSIDLARYAWTWPQDFEPTETTGVLRLAGSTCNAPDAPGELRWKWKWYGGMLMLERSEICNALLWSTPAMIITAAQVPPPWNVAAVAAIAVHDGWLFSRIGRRGVRLEFNWSGTLHRVVTRPEGTRPLPTKKKCAGAVKFCTDTICMCEDAPDPLHCECLMREELDDC